jgi:hypothetical protein
MNIFFASVHGALTTELGILCRGTGHRLFVLARECTLVHAEQGHTISERGAFADLGIEFIGTNEELRDRIKEADLFVIVTLRQEELTRRLVPGRRAVIAAIPAERSREFNHRGIQNFLSPSARHLSLLTARNKFLYRKLVRREAFPATASVDERFGFYSYIHWMEKYWPMASQKLRRLNAISPVKVRNFGFGSDEGAVDDLTFMKAAKATIHIKDLGVACNAPVRSLALGTPVVMDHETYINGFFDCIDGITVVPSVDAVALEIAKLETDAVYLAEKVSQAEQASRQFTFRKEHGDAFAKFLENAI